MGEPFSEVQAHQTLVILDLFCNDGITASVAKQPMHCSKEKQSASYKQVLYIKVRNIQCTVGCVLKSHVHKQVVGSEPHCCLFTMAVRRQNRVFKPRPYYYANPLVSHCTGDIFSGPTF